MMARCARGTRRPEGALLTRNDRSRFACARLWLGADRFTISVWDYEPAALLLGALLYGGFDLLSLLPDLPTGVALALCGGLGLLAGIGHRVVTVTRGGAWCENRLLGIPWRRRDLGWMPRFTSGDVRDWSELAVIPSEQRLRAGLHDDERFILADWSGDDVKERDGKRLSELANAETARLHGSGRRGLITSGRWRS